MNIKCHFCFPFLLYNFASSLVNTSPTRQTNETQSVEVNPSSEVNIQQEFNALKESEDPEPDPSIEYLIVLSASNSYLKKSTARHSADLEDDYNRMQLALKTAKKIVALRIHVRLEEINMEQLRRYGPRIVYNGSEQQNQDLKYALEHCIQDYPKEKFIILDLPKHEINTKGQFLSLKQELPLDNVSIGMITHAYHYPRLSRMLGEEAPLYPFGANVAKYAFLVDRHFTSPGIEDRVRDEIKKIPIYIDKGDLAKYPASDVKYLQIRTTSTFKPIQLHQGVVFKA